MLLRLDWKSVIVCFRWNMLECVCLVCVCVCMCVVYVTNDFIVAQ